MKVSFLLLTSIFILISSSVFSLSLDEKLQQVINVYNLQVNSCDIPTQNVDENLSELGAELFRSKELSGDKDVSCATCHIEEDHLIDGLSISVGVGGEDEGIERLNSNGVIVPRNSFTLVGRGGDIFSSYFWDGKVQQDSNELIISPFGDQLDPKFNSLLSIAAVLPLIARDEFLGQLQMFDENEHIAKINDEYYSERYLSASAVFRDLISEPNNTNFEKLKLLFIDAEIDPSSIDLADIGNAIAAFIATEFKCNLSNWDSYISGNTDSLDDHQKNGALIFFGKGRCAACHSGPVFSDFEYHSIASPQGGFGVSTLGQDFGRSEISLSFNDRYLFRTPPLIDVSNTAPYGHSGQFETLESVVMHHLNPVVYFTSQTWENNFELLNYGKILGSRDDVLTYIDILNFEELDDLLSFLNSL